jgi:hypothetical protein
MVGWMLVAIGLAGFSTPAALDSQPASLGRGVTVTPADGWISAENVWNVGPGAISLQRAGVLVAFGADTYPGTTQLLMDEQLASLREQFRAFRPLPAAPATIDTDVPALKVLFSGTSDSGAVQGELVTGTSGGTGLVMLAIAPPGQLARVQSDLDRMLASVTFPQ